MSPILTIVVPTLNSGRTLEATLTSIIKASNGLIRLVVVDSASTDNTGDICRHHGVEMLQTPPGNMYKAINVGLRTATTPWLTYINSDDYVFPTAYSSMLDWATRTEAEVIYGRGDVVDSDGTFLHSQIPPPGHAIKAVLKSGILPFLQPSAIFRRETWLAANGFCVDYRHVADFDYFCRLALMGCQFQRFKQGPVVAFRLGRGQLSSREADVVRQERRLATRKLALNRRTGDLIHWIAWKVSNVPSYGCRVIRYRDIAGTLTMPKAMELPRV